MSETGDQMALFDFLARVEGRYPLLAYVFHPANEASGGGAKVRVQYTKRDGSAGWRQVPVEALQNARMGVKAGVWDVWAPFRNRADVWGYPARVFVGLVIEMKTEQGALSTEQEAWRDFLREEGWGCQVCREWTDAARLLVTWAGGEPGEVGL